MSNPFIQNIPTDNSVRISPQVTVVIPPNPSIVNYPLASTGFNSSSTYFQTSGGPSVTSLNNFINDILITSPDNSINITDVAGNPSEIQLSVNPINVGVQTLNTFEGDITITSPDNSVNITDVAGNPSQIQLTVDAVNVGVQSLNTFEGAITITSPNGSVNITDVAGNPSQIQLEVPAVDVGVSQIVAGSNVTISPTGGTGIVTINAVAGPTGVTSLNAVTGDVTITGADGAVVTGGLINPIVVTVPLLAGAIATADTALADATLALANAGTAQTTATTALGLATTANAGVTTILSSYVTQITAGTGVSISPEGGTGNVTINATGVSGVASLNTLTGDLSLTSTNGSISITPSGTNIDLSVPLTATGFAIPVLTDVGNTTWSIAIAGLDPTSIVLATITDVDNVSIPQDCWLINAFPSTDLITFNMSSPITTGTTLKISYHITQF